MKWTKASERKPTLKGDYFIKKEYGTDLEQMIVLYWNEDEFTDGVYDFEAEQLLWLDENPPTPASLQDEAARLYPNPNSLLERDTPESRLAEAQRSAHITCARMYLSRLAEKDGEIEGLKNELMAQYDTLSEELGELKNITEGLPTRIINQQRDLLVAYRNKIALTPGITVETILAMLEDDIKTLRAMDGGEIVKNITEQSNDKS